MAESESHRPASPGDRPPIVAEIVRPRRRTPSPWLTALLAILLLGAGVALGQAAGDDAKDAARRAARQTIEVVVASGPTGSATLVETPAATTTLPPATSTAATSSPTASTPSATTTAATSTPTSSTGLAPVGHVWLIVMSDQRFGQVWSADSPVQWFNTVLRPKGTLIRSYYAIAHGTLANTVALISGQQPTSLTKAGCGKNCLYSSSVKTIGDQLTAAGKTWKAYISAFEPGPRTRNPFSHFDSLTDNDRTYRTRVVTAASLTEDLRSPARIPSFRDISAPQGTLAVQGKFVDTAIAAITATAEYKNDGLIVLTSDQAPAKGKLADSRGGGGKVGAFLMSRFVASGVTRNKPDYDHFSLLRSIEKLFGLEPLGAAADNRAHPAFGPKVYAKYTP